MFFKPSEKKILDKIQKFLDEAYSGQTDILDFSIVKRNVTVVLSVEKKMDSAKAALIHDAVQDLVASMRGVQKANVVMTKDKGELLPNTSGNKIKKPVEEGMPANDSLVPDVRHIIAVASGKGGVGKSTIACNLAIALAKQGLSVGLLDADVYGPSQAHMMGVADKKPETVKRGDKSVLIPVESHGVKVMSMAFLVEQDKALIWRGAMVQKAVTQMLRDVEWGNLDVLVVDMPPGTGDAALTLAQKVPLSGAVIVSTPQDIALMDAVRGVEMFQKVNVPIIGMIENMSIFCCPNCGHQVDFFSQGGVKKKSVLLNVPFLGALPLEASVCEASEAGQPVILYHPKSEHSRAFKEMAATIKQNFENE